jgi:hypothetical protein
MNVDSRTRPSAQIRPSDRELHLLQPVCLQPRESSLLQASQSSPFVKRVDDCNVLVQRRWTVHNAGVILIESIVHLGLGLRPPVQHAGQGDGAVVVRPELVPAAPVPAKDVEA